MSERRVRQRMASTRSRLRLALTGHPARRRREGLTRWVAGAAAVGLVAVGLVATVEPPAAAAGAANPWTQLQLALSSDGTGHGTAAATFVNGANGFSPGDNSPDDGVVASRDIVTYALGVQFEPGPARTVAVTLQVPEYLTWPGGDSFCRNGALVTATRVGDTCYFTVPAGAVETIKTSVTMVAGDTGGRAITQTLRATVAVKDDGVFAEAGAKPVTVVSAPAVDVVLTAAPFTTLGANGMILPGRNTNWASRPTGTVIATPVPMTMPGYSAEKGAAITGPWSGRLDVSSFPAGTTWTVNGVARTPADGFLALSSTGGAITIGYTVPGATWPEQPEGSSVDYPLRVVVDPASFSTPGGYRNNGTGWQPGDGFDRNGVTYDPQRGSQAGRPWPNNDWATVRVVRDVPPPDDPALVSKGLYGPWDPFATLWEDGNTSYAAPSGENSRQAGLVAPGTELTAGLFLFTEIVPEVLQDGVTPMTTEQLVVGDSWDNTEQFLDLSRPITVTGPDGKVVPSTRYVVQWSAQPKTEQEIGNPNLMTGWVPGLPANGESAAAVRLVFAPNALPTGVEDGAGTFLTRVPMKVRDGFTQQDNGRRIQDLGAAGIVGAGPGVIPGRLSLERWVDLAMPPTTALSIETTVTEVNGTVVTDPVAAPGDVVTFQAAPKVEGLHSSSDPVMASVTVELDRCLTRPVNTTPGWTMTITTPAAPNPVTGKICGDPLSTPAVVTFTPTAGTSAAVTWTDRMAGNGTLPKITFTAEIGAAVTYEPPVALAATVALDTAAMEIEDVIPASDDVVIPVSYIVRGSAGAEGMDVEIIDPFTVTVKIEAGLGDQGGAGTDTVIVLPYDGDGSLYDDYLADTPYDGVQASGFHGTYTIASVTLDPETSARSTLFYTTSPAARDLSERAPDCCTWVALPQGAALPADATAIRVSLAEGDVGPSRAELSIEFLPQGNKAGDVYLTWLSATQLPGIEGPSVEQPWPATVRVVSSSIHGTVWDDYDSDGRMDRGEPGFGGVTVELMDLATGRSMGTAVTASDGSYSFTELHSGRYQVVVVDRGENIPATVTTYYGQTLPVTTTYSYLNRFASASRERSTEIALPADTVLPLVDFGYHKPNPKIALDKSEAKTTCDEAVCTVSWDVTVTNEGTDPLDDVVLHDRLGDDAFEVTAVGAEALNAVQMAGGNSTVYALSPGGTVYAWGSNAQGALGDGSGLTGQAASPVTVVPTAWAGATVVQVAAGMSTGYALTDDGAVYQWGTRPGTSTGTSVAERVAGSAWAGKEIIQVAGGSQTGYALASDGSVYAWGVGTGGQLGQGALVTSVVPVAVTGTWGDATITQIASRGGTAYALASDGSVWAWGANTYGQLGDGSTTTRTTPVRVGGENWPQVPIVSIAAGTQAAYAIDENGTVWAWGSDSRGQLGNDATIANVALPVAIPAEVWEGRTITQIVPADITSYALASDGTVYAWGAGTNGLLGNGDDALNNPLPVRAGTGTLPGGAVVGLAAVNAAGYAIASDGSVYSWGQGGGGRLGTEDRDVFGTWVPVQVAEWQRTQTARLSVFMESALALTGDGRVFSWGSNANGQLGRGTVGAAENQPSPGLVAPASLPQGEITDVAMGGSAAYALAADGSIYAWGSNAMGQLGNGQTSLVPTVVPERVDLSLPAGVHVIKIAAGNNTGYAVTSDGSVYAWGADTDYGLGDGEPIATQPTPVQVLRNWGDDPVVDISVWGTSGWGPSVTAVTAGGQIWTWGDNTNSRLGGTGTSPLALPSAAWAGSRIVDVALGHRNGYAMADDGRVFAWGQDYFGAFGPGSTGSGAYRPPTEVLFDFPAKPVGIAVATAGVSSYSTPVVVLDDGSLYAWGYNSAGTSSSIGMFGNGTTEEFSATPVRVAGTAWGDSEIIQVAASGSSAFALADDGTAYSWGADGQGKLGNGILGNATYPAPIDGPWATWTPWITLGNRLAPISTDKGEGTITRAYSVPGPLLGGESQTVQFTATYLRSTVDRAVVNQAWVDSPLTPKDPPPAPATIPEYDDVDARGVPGNARCNTDATTQVPEDSCDQVPAQIPRFEGRPAAIKGVTWIEDEPLDGKRVEPSLDDLSALFEERLDGVIVRLYRVEGDGLTQVGEQLTGAFPPRTTHGGHYFFDDLPPGDYQVQFVISHLAPTWPRQWPPKPEPLFRAMAATLLEGGMYVFTTAGPDATNMNVDPSTGMSQPVTVPAGEVGIVDAGVYLVGPVGIEVDKTSAGDGVWDENGVLVRQAGDNRLTTELPVTVTVTNPPTSDEVLTGFVFTDTTTDGVPIDDTTWTCGYDVVLTEKTWPAGAAIADQLPLAELAPGESFTCTGILPPLAYGETHADTVTVVGRGATTGRLVDAGDDFTTRTLDAPQPGIAVTKASLLGDSEEGPDGTLMQPLYRVSDGGQLPPMRVFFRVDNTGTEPLTNIAWTDATSSGPAVVWPETACVWFETTADGGTLPHLLTLSNGVLVERLEDGTTASFALPPEQRLTCVGDLPAMAPDELHVDTVTVTARGSTTGEPVMGADQFATAGTAIGVDKVAVIDGEPVVPEPQPVLLPAPDGTTAPLEVRVTVSNLGSEALTNLVLTDVTDAGIDVENWQCTGADLGAAGELTANGEPLVLAPGDSLTCAGTLPPMDAGDPHADTVTITATGVGSGEDLSDADSLAVASSGISVDKVAVVDGAAVDPDPDPVVLTGTGGKTPVTPVRVTITNDGGEPVTDLVFTDVTHMGPEVGGWLCAGAEIRAADGVLTAGGTPLVLGPGDSLICTGELPAMDLGLEHSDTVTVTATGVDSGFALSDDDPLAVTTAEPVAGLTIEKRAAPAEVNGAAGVNPGDRIVWSFTVTNTGETTLEDVTVVDPMVGAVTLDTTTLAPGESASGSVTSTVTEADLAAGKVENTAHATAVNPVRPDEPVESPPDTATTVITPAPPGEPKPPAGSAGSGDKPVLFTGPTRPLAWTGMTLTGALIALVLGSTGFALLAARRRAVPAPEEDEAQE